MTGAITVLEDRDLVALYVYDYEREHERVLYLVNDIPKYSPPDINKLVVLAELLLKELDKEYDTMGAKYTLLGVRDLGGPYVYILTDHPRNYAQHAMHEVQEL